MLDDEDHCTAVQACSGEAGPINWLSHVTAQLYHGPAHLGGALAPGRGAQGNRAGRGRGAGGLPLFLTLTAAHRVVCLRQAAAPKAIAAAESGGASGLFNFLGGLVRGTSSAGSAPGEKKEMNSDALLHGAQNLLGNDTLSALGAAVFPFILARPGRAS